MEALQAEERRIVTRLRELQQEREAAEVAVLRAVIALVRGERNGSTGSENRSPTTGEEPMQ